MRSLGNIRVNGTAYETLRVSFCVSQNRRAYKQHPVGRVFKSFFESLRVGFVTWIADHMERYVFNVYALHHNVSKRPPSIGGCTAAGRVYVKMDPESVWSMVETARSTGVPISEVYKVKRSDVECGAHHKIADSIEAYEVGLYAKRAKLSFQWAWHV